MFSSFAVSDKQGDGCNEASTDEVEATAVHLAFISVVDNQFKKLVFTDTYRKFKSRS